MIRVAALALFLIAMMLGPATGCATTPGAGRDPVAEPGGTRGRLGLTEAAPVRARWREAGDQPSHWVGSLTIRALEPAPKLADIGPFESDQLLPDGVYPASIAEPTQRYIEVLEIWDDTGRVHSDSSSGDGTLPRFDIMLSERFHGHTATRDPTIGVGVRLPDDSAKAVSARGNIVIPRFLDEREVLLPLDTLRAADTGTLALGRGRSVTIGQVTERVRVGREMEDQLVEQVTISVDLATNSAESLPIALVVVTEDGRTLPVTRWHAAGRGGVGPKGWSIAMRPGEIDPAGRAVALRVTLADCVEFERRVFELRDVPIDYAPKPEPKAAGR